MQQQLVPQTQRWKRHHTISQNAWPSWSPDLSSPEFHLSCGFLKDNMYKNKIHALEEWNKIMRHASQEFLEQVFTVSHQACGKRVDISNTYCNCNPNFCIALGCMTFWTPCISHVELISLLLKRTNSSNIHSKYHCCVTVTLQKYHCCITVTLQEYNCCITVTLQLDVIRRLTWQFLEYSFTSQTKYWCSTLK